MKIVLYTNHCPQCKMLEEVLRKDKLEYVTVTDENLMMEKGFRTMPMLEVDGQIYTFAEAVRLLKERRDANVR